MVLERMLIDLDESGWQASCSARIRTSRARAAAAAAAPGSGNVKPGGAMGDEKELHKDVKLQPQAGIRLHDGAAVHGERSSQASKGVCRSGCVGAAAKRMRWKVVGGDTTWPLLVATDGDAMRTYKNLVAAEVAVRRGSWIVDWAVTMGDCQCCRVGS